MIVDSHAHYAHASYQNTFRYLTLRDDAYTIAEGTLNDLLQEMEQANIRCSIEPGISLASNRAILELCGRYPGRVFPAIGVHPTRTFREKWKDRKQLKALLDDPRVVALGETGLDYHYERREQHRLCQLFWFLYQLNLAHGKKLPVILHIRQAHQHALTILRRNKRRLHGGVVHCFNSDWDTASRYLALGFHLGIGGELLKRGDRAEMLVDAVRHIPLERILVETDSPYILPDCKDTIKPKLLRRTRNSSLILPRVIEKIAELKQIPPQTVEQVTAENAIRLFSLPVGR